MSDKDTDENDRGDTGRLRPDPEQLRAEADFGYVNGKPALVKLNNGIEFATMYLAMLLALLFIGGGRYVSIDWLVANRRREAKPIP